MNEQEKLVAVLKTTDPGLLPLVKSVLDAADIPYIVQGEAGVGLFPLGPAGQRVSHRMTGAIVLVPESRLEEARALLETPGESLE